MNPSNHQPSQETALAAAGNEGLLMVEVTTSQRDIPIRLTDERQNHILEGHPELIDNKTDVLKVVSNPERILEGKDGELIGIREIKTDKWLVVVYKELGSDGFIVTAYSTSRIRSLTKRRQLWP